MPNVQVAQPVLEQACISTFVGKDVPARVAQHMRMDMPEAGAGACSLDEVVHVLTGYLAAQGTEKQPRQVVVPRP